MAAKRSRTARRDRERSPRTRGGTDRVLAHLSSDWYWEQDAKLRFTRVEVNSDATSDKALAAFLIGKTRWETGMETEGGWEAHRALLKARKPFRDVLAWRTFEDGSRRYVSVSGEPVLDARGRFAGYRGIGRDITAQKRGELLLRLEHSVTKLLAEVTSSPGALKAPLRAICGTEGWDYAEFWKLDEAARIMRLLEYWCSPQDEQAFRELDKLREATFTPGTGLVGSVWQSGVPLWVSDVTVDARVKRREIAKRTGLRAVLLVPVHAGGKVIGVLGFASRRARPPQERLIQALSVISAQFGQYLQRTQAEHAMRASEARFRGLTELSSDWYWEQDSEFRFTFMSGRFADATGMDERHYLGHHRWDEPALNLSEGDWARHRAQLERHEPFHDFEVQRRTGEGRSLWVSLSGEPTFDGGGRFAGYRGVGRDITEQKRGEQLLRLEHHVALSLADAADAASGLKAVLRAFCEAEGWACGRYFEVDEAGGVLRFREAWCIADAVMQNFVERSRALAFRPGEGLAGLAWQSAEPIWSSDTRADRRVHATQLQIGTNIRGAFVFTVGAAGKVLGVVSFTSQTVREPDERLRRAALVIGRQIGQFVQRKRAEEAVRESEARFRSLTQMSADFFWETDAQHRFTEMVHGPNYVAKFGRALLGKTAWELPSTVPDEAGWATLRASFDAHEPFRDFEFARPWPDGGTRYFTVSGEPRFAAGGGFLGYRGVGRETTEIAIAREHIASLAYSDALTGLANRTSLGPAFDQAVERARRRSTKLAALFIDLDGFKPVNDAYGHNAGDRLLIEVARRLRASLRASDLVARLGGDEFFVVLEDVHEDGVLEAVARKLLVEIARPYELASSAQARISASMGISIYPDDASDAAGVMKHADMAMYAAKQAGKNAFRFYVAGETADPLTRARAS